MGPDQWQTAFLACLMASLLSARASRDSAELPSNQAGPRGSEKQLLLELQDVLEKLQSKRNNAWESKFNQMPKCIMGDLCAVKRGSRIGKLCDCPSNSHCNFFFLKCL